MTEFPTDLRRYVAIGDSFTEGMVDENPSDPGSYVGWADRVAEVLAQQVEETIRLAGSAEVDAPRSAAIAERTTLMIDTDSRDMKSGTRATRRIRFCT